MVHLMAINSLADISSRNWKRIEQLFFGFFPEARAETGMVGHGTSIEHGRLNRWQLEAVGYIKASGFLFIRNAFVGFFSYE